MPDQIGMTMGDHSLTGLVPHPSERCLYRQPIIIAFDLERDRYPVRRLRFNSFFSTHFGRSDGM